METNLDTTTDTPSRRDDVGPVPLLDLKPQFADIREEVLAAVARVFESQHFILGPEGAALEREVAEYSGVAHPVG
jgi:dTDP-4-amino-4,6-dideoxygalactose transaminase